MILKRLSVSLFILFSLISTATIFPISYAGAQDAGDAVCDTLGQATGSCDTRDGAGGTISGVIKGALNLLTFAAGIATVIMVIIAGVKYMTSQGDASAVANAKNTLLYALVGVVIVVLSQTIIFFFISSSSPSDNNPGGSQQRNRPI